MKRFLSTAWLLFLLAGLSMACASPLAATPTPPPATPPTDDPYLATRDGEPRSAGYWLLWNSCAPDNRAETARANGGREAGWIIVDDLLQDPGILLGDLAITTCPQAVNLLERKELSGSERAGDAAYQLAAQLLAAQLNMASGSESCRAAEEAVQGAQLLLLSLEFKAAAPYFGDSPGTPARNTAVLLIETLADYNVGNLCLP